jgi:hypothetical protein
MTLINGQVSGFRRRAGRATRSAGRILYANRGTDKDAAAFHLTDCTLTAN